MKIIYVLLDGVGDIPTPSLNFLTPLEAARTKTLDNLARRGSLGMVTPVRGGFPPESDVAVFSMLGYDFGVDYVGRGVIESVGRGVEFNNGDVALRINFATVDSNLNVIDRRAGRNLTTNESNELTNTIREELILNDQKATFTLESTEAHRGVLVLRVEDSDLSSDVTNTDPAVGKMGGFGIAKKFSDGMKLEICMPMNNSYQAHKTSKLINEFSSKAISIMRDHPVNVRRKDSGKYPANALLLRDASNRRPKVQPIREKYNMDFACIVDLPVEKGIAKFLGMKPVHTDNLTDFEEKAEKTAELLDTFDGVYIHIKGPDEAGHDGDAKLKKKIIEDIDERFFKTVVNLIDIEETVISVSGDHSTPCEMESHSTDPVPLLVSGSRVSRDNVCRFTEKDGAKGALGMMFGSEVLTKVLSF